MDKKLQYISAKQKGIAILILVVWSQVVRIGVAHFFGFSTGIVCSIVSVWVGFFAFGLYCLISGKRFQSEQTDVSSIPHSASPEAEKPSMKGYSCISEEKRQNILLILFLSASGIGVLSGMIFGFSVGVSLTLLTAWGGILSLCLYSLITKKYVRVDHIKGSSSTYHSTSPGADIATAMTMNGGTYGGPYNFGPYG